PLPTLEECAEYSAIKERSNSLSACAELCPRTLYECAEHRSAPFISRDNTSLQGRTLTSNVNCFYEESRNPSFSCWWSGKVATICCVIPNSLASSALIILPRRSMCATTSESLSVSCAITKIVPCNSLLNIASASSCACTGAVASVIV